MNCCARSESPIACARAASCQKGATPLPFLTCRRRQSYHLGRVDGLKPSAKLLLLLAARHRRKYSGLDLPETATLVLMVAPRSLTPVLTGQRTARLNLSSSHRSRWLAHRQDSLWRCNSSDRLFREKDLEMRLVRLTAYLSRYQFPLLRELC